MKKLLFLTVCAAMTQSACLQIEPHETMYVWIQEEGFSDLQIHLIHEALHEWENGLDGFVHFTLVNGKGYNPLIVVRATTRKALNDEYPGSIGVCLNVPWETGGGIYLPKDIGSVKFQRDVRHEIGHALNLSHTHNTYTTMYPNLMKQPQHLTCEDVLDFCNQNGNCDGSKMRICQTDKET